MQMVPSCSLAADIGCDHGKLGLHLLHSGRCEQVLFADISAESLSKAKKLLARHQLAHLAAFVVADGLLAVTRPVDAIIISGLGGHTMLDILLQGADRVGNAALILSPQTEAPALRAGLSAGDFALLEEAVILSRGRYYTVIRAVHAGERQDAEERDLYIGRNLRPLGEATVAGYLRWRLDVLQMDRQADPKHIRWLKEETARAAGNQSDHL